MKTFSQKCKTIRTMSFCRRGLIGIPYITLFYIGFMFFIGCNSPSSDIPPQVKDHSDLDDPVIRNRIFEVAINELDLQVKETLSGEKIYHAPQDDQPYTGWVKNIRKLQQFQNGKKHGIYISWYGNWQKVDTGYYKNGVRDGLWIYWNPIGKKETEGSYKNGIRDGLWTLWDRYGEKEREITYEYGRMLNSIRKPNAETNNNELGEHSGVPDLHAFVVRDSSLSRVQFGLPKGAIRRIGKGIVKDIQISPDGSRIAVATSIGIWMYDTQNGEEIAAPGDIGPVRKLLFSPDSKTLATIGNNITVYLWDAITGIQKRNFNGHNVSIKSILFSPDGRMLASMNSDKSTRLWDVQSGEHLHTISTGMTDNMLMSFSPDGVTFVTGKEGKLQIWDTLTGLQKYTLTSEQYNFNDVIFSHDGLSMLTQNSDGRVHIWDARTWQQKNIPMQYDQNDVSTVSISPDGNTLVLGHRDGRVSLWNTQTWEHIHSFTEHNVWVKAVSFSPNGVILASGDGYGTIHLWDLHTRKLINTIGIKTLKTKTSHIIINMLNQL